MKICLEISLELHRYDAILMKFMTYLELIFTASMQRVNSLNANSRYCGTSVLYYIPNSRNSGMHLGPGGQVIYRALFQPINIREIFSPYDNMSAPCSVIVDKYFGEFSDITSSFLM